VPLVLAASRYDLSFDLVRGSGSFGLDIGLLPVGGGARITLTNSISFGQSGGGANRIAFPFALQNAGTFQPDVRFTGSSNTCHVDDVVIHDVRPLFFNIGQFSRASGQAASYSVVGSPNQFFAVLLGFGLGAPLVIPGCQYDLLLNTGFGVATYIPFTSLGANGVYTGSVTVPAVASGLPLYWQPLAITPGCESGCADMIAFP
jgi:hypothetical protein